MGAVIKGCALSTITVSLLLLAGCTQATNPKASEESKAAAKEAAGPPQLVTAKTAFWPMYTSARKWTPDVVALRLTPKDVPGFTNEGGKAAMWEAMFASPSLHQSRLYTYSIASAPPDIYKGVVGGLQVPWSGETRDAMPIDLSLFNVDSDAAYQTADKDAEVWLKRAPDKKLASFELGDIYKFDVPVWYLMWGDKKAGYVAYVDASSGNLLKGK